MNSTIINIKTKPETKQEAQRFAEELGVSLSALINGFLHTLIKTKTVYFTTTVDEEPNTFMRLALEEAMEDVKAMRVSPSFSDARSALQWLHKEAKIHAH